MLLSYPDDSLFQHFCSILHVQFGTFRGAKIAAEFCPQDTKEAVICIDDKYGLLKFTKFYQINHYFSYFSTKTSYKTGSIVNWGVGY